MPGVTLHLHLAERTLEHWRGLGGAPFPLDRADAVEAFRQGAFGPDIGYFPGGPTALSDLSHAHRTADLCRTLVDVARTPVEAAYAWGWVSHVVADVAVHPLLGCAVGELVHGTAGRFVEGDADPESHGRVESGLDSLFARNHPELRSRAPRAVLDATSVGLLTVAYERVYGIELPPAAVLKAHRSAARRASQGLALATFTARRLGRVPTLRTGEGEGGLRRRVGRSFLAFAYVLPVRPAHWLVRGVRAFARAFPKLLDQHVRSGLIHLRNRNLDTGELEAADPHHGAALRARRFLAEQRAARRIRTRAA